MIGQGKGSGGCKSGRNRSLELDRGVIWTASTRVGGYGGLMDLLNFVALVSNPVRPNAYCDGALMHSRVVASESNQIPSAGHPFTPDLLVCGACGVRSCKSTAVLGIPWDGRLHHIRPPPFMIDQPQGRKLSHPFHHMCLQGRSRSLFSFCQSFAARRTLAGWGGL